MELLKDNKLNEALKNASGWTHDNGHIKKTFQTQGYPQTMGFVTTIGCICQKLNHHPDYIRVKFKDIEVSFSTHSAGGVTDNDVNSAIEVNKAFSQ